MKFGLGGFHGVAFHPGIPVPAAEKDAASLAKKVRRAHAAAHTLAVARSAYFEVRARAAKEIRAVPQKVGPIGARLRQLLRRKSKPAGDEEGGDEAVKEGKLEYSIHVPQNSRKVPFEPPMQENVEKSEDSGNLGYNVFLSLGLSHPGLWGVEISCTSSSAFFLGVGSHLWISRGKVVAAVKLSLLFL